MAYFIVALLFIVAVAALGYVAFRAGYNLGWHERDVDMRITPAQAERRVQMMSRMRHTGVWNA
jgi:hypothetical protein